MYTGLNRTVGAYPFQLPDTTQKSVPTALPRRLFFPILLLMALAVVAVIPRLILARQLDVVTDEVVYLWAAKIYVPLLLHLNLGSAQWGQVNYEHPPLAKLLMGTSIGINNLLGHPLNELLAGRLASVLMGTVLVLAVYWLGKDPFGAAIALIAALALAVSPWLCYFSAIAYLDMTMVSLVTIAYLCLWHATRNPKYYLVVALFMGLAVAAKYPAAYVIPTIILFTAYYYFLLCPMMPIEQRPALPWRWWIAAALVALGSFYIADPAIWLDPIGHLIRSFGFELGGNLSVGHPTFLAGQILMHVPVWTMLYMTFIKMSAFLTLPAAFFVIFALVHLLRFHRRTSSLDYIQASKYAYLVIWLLGVLLMFSTLNIAVGTHYYLPLAPSVAVAGVAGMAIILQYLANLIWKKAEKREELSAEPQSTVPQPLLTKKHFKPQYMLPMIVLILVAIVPPLLSLTTVYGAEGYTTEFFNNNENAQLQVAYPAYREALEWLATDTHTHASVGLVGTYLNGDSSTSNWFHYNQDLGQRFHLAQVDPTAKPQIFQSYDYLVWPMNTWQRGAVWPLQDHIVHRISGGNTIYCYILQVNN